MDGGPLTDFYRVQCPLSCFALPAPPIKLTTCDESLYVTENNRYQHDQSIAKLCINGESQENVSSFIAVDPLSLSTVIDFHHVVDWSSMDLVEGWC